MESAAPITVVLITPRLASIRLVYESYAIAFMNIPYRLVTPRPASTLEHWIGVKAIFRIGDFEDELRLPRRTVSKRTVPTLKGRLGTNFRIFRGASQLQLIDF